MRTFLSICTIIISLPILRAQDSVSVLFIGNSYTYVNDLPTMVKDLAASLGDIVYKDSQTLGGATFQTHATNAATYTKINAELWDFVVLQAQSQEPSFPDAQVDSQTLPYAVQLSDSVYANRFCSDVMYFMTWGRENGDPQWQPISTFDGMNARLRAAYMRFADSTEASISAVGSAWKYVRDNYPAIGLYSGDGSHPSVHGSYLAACTFYASLFRKSPVGASYISSLSAADAAILQNAAALTVLDSLDQWNLRPLSEHTQADFSFAINGNTVDFTNLSTKAQSYAWDFGDLGTSAAEDPSYTYATDGTYTVSLIAYSPCDTDTIEYQLTVGNTGLSDQSIAGLKVKSLQDGTFILNSDLPMDRVQLIDVNNRILEEKIIDSNIVELDLARFEAGVYFIVIDQQDKQVMIRVFNK